MAEISYIGKYEIRREIGRGAMGVVYEGYDPSIKRIVALKTIRAEQLTGGDPAAVIARFRREAQAAGRLNHPNIVSIYDFGEDSGVWYIAMELSRVVSSRSASRRTSVSRLPTSCGSCRRS